MRRSTRTAAVAATAALVLACLVVGHLRRTGGASELFEVRAAARQQQLAYDGPYDTPPVTWYYPATTNQENTLGYTWDGVNMQNTEVIYTPGMVSAAVPSRCGSCVRAGRARVQTPDAGFCAQMTDEGIVTSTEQTVGFPTGETTTTYPLGTGIEYQNSEENYAGLASKRPLHPATLKFMLSRDEAAANGWPARYQSLADSSGLDAMDTALRQAKGKDSISGKEDLLTKKLDAAFDAINGKSTAVKRKPERKSYSDMDEELEDMRLSDDLVNAAGSASARGRRGSKADRGGKSAKRKAKKLQSLAYSVDPYEVDPNAETSASVQVNGDTAMQMIWSPGGNVAGSSVVNLASSDDRSGPKWSTSNDVQLQSPALVMNQLPPAIPAPGPMMHMPMYPGQPPYSFHVNHGGYPPSVKGEIWSYDNNNGNKNGPEYWGKLNRAWGVCGVGENQSPINVELNVRRDDELKMLRWVGPNDPYQATLVSPLYKNVLMLENLRGSMMVSGLKMELKSATIHTPSEHKLQGRRMPAEIQFLHEAAVGGEGVKVIVSVFVDIGVKTAPFLRNFMTGVGQFLGTYNVDPGGGTGSYVFPTIGQDVKPPIWFNTAMMAEDVLGAGSNYANYFTYYGRSMRARTYTHTHTHTQFTHERGAKLCIHAPRAQMDTVTPRMHAYASIRASPCLSLCCTSHAIWCHCCGRIANLEACSQAQSRARHARKE